MKKNAAIISLYGNSNYGNKLQAYAVQETLKKYDLNVVNIRNIPIFNDFSNSKFNQLKCFVYLLLRNIINKNNYLKCIDYSEPKERTENFLEFDKLLNNTNYIFCKKNIKKLNNIDCFFVGSDQVWNPNYGGLSDLNLLTFTKKMKIALSASFGVSNISDKDKGKIQKYISNFDYVSTREKEGKKILESVLKNKKIEVLIDPTMMLKDDEWDNVVKKPKLIRNNEKYVLCYFLGEFDSKYIEEIKIYAKKHKYKIIDLSNKTDSFYNCGPSEFLYLEKNAEFIFTDSFHSCVFALIFKKKFMVYNRLGKHDNMNSRIKTLLSTFKLDDRLYINSINDKKIDYGMVNKILTSERKKFDLFISSAIERIGDKSE